MTSLTILNNQNYVRLLDENGVVFSTGNPLPCETTITSAEVTQDTASALNCTVHQSTASNLNCTVVQGTASNLLAQVSNAGTFSVQEDGDALTALQSVDAKLPSLDGSSRVPVTVGNASLVVSATDLDIRALVNTDVISAEITQNRPTSAGAVWSASSTGVDGNSSTHELKGTTVTFFGTCSGSTTLTLWLSNDDSTWYKSNHSAVLSGSNPHFELTAVLGCKYSRLQSSNDVTASVIASSR